MDRKRLLKNLYLFIGATPSDLDALDAIAEPKSFIVGDFAFHEGEVADALFVVETGSVDILPVGKEAVFTTVGSGQAFGELSFFENGTRPASASARERTEILRIPYEKLSRLLAARPELALIVYRNGCKFFAKHFRAVARELNYRYL
jgi:CRP-like cAMP-binding protein